MGGDENEQPNTMTEPNEYFFAVSFSIAALVAAEARAQTRPHTQEGGSTPLARLAK